MRSSERRLMKNIQVIDAAINSAYNIYSVPDETFEKIFPAGRDIEFVEDFFDRVGNVEAQNALEPAWQNKVDKKDVVGIHGTLFYGLKDEKEQFYPNKKETDLDA